jgi:hypothetical protein
MKTISIRVFAIALAAILTTAFAAPAIANDENKVIPVELKFIGNLKDQPLFHLEFNSPDEEEYTIVIRDEFGNTFYRQSVKGKSFIKKFLLNVEELSDETLKFEVSAKGYDKPVVFEVNNQSRFVKEMVVNKVK